MASGGIYVEGLRETVKAFEAAGVDLDELKDVMGGIAKVAAETFASHTPSRSGKLRASVRGNRAKGSAVVTAGRASVQYAGPIFYGWQKRGITPSRTIERTDAEMENKAADMLEQGFADIMERHGL